MAKLDLLLKNQNDNQRKSSGPKGMLSRMCQNITINEKCYQSLKKLKQSCFSWAAELENKVYNLQEENIW